MGYEVSFGTSLGNVGHSKNSNLFNNNNNMEHIGYVVRMSVSGYRGCRFETRNQYVVSFSKILCPHCFSRLSCEMSTRWGQPREGCSVL